MDDHAEHVDASDDADVDVDVNIRNQRVEVTRQQSQTQVDRATAPQSIFSTQMPLPKKGAVKEAMPDASVEASGARIEPFASKEPPQNDLVRGGGGSGDNEEHGVGSDHATYTVTLPNQKVGLSLRGERPALILDLVPGGDADRAGVTRGSELLRINGSDVTTTSHNACIDAIVNATRPVRLELRRASTASRTLPPPPSRPAPSPRAALLRSPTSIESDSESSESDAGQLQARQQAMRIRTTNPKALIGKRVLIYQGTTASKQGGSGAGSSAGSSSYSSPGESSSEGGGGAAGHVLRGTPRAGEVTGVRKGRLGKATKHTIAFDDGTTSNVLLQKGEDGPGSPFVLEGAVIRDHAFTLR